MNKNINKKTLFLILFSVILFSPVITYAQSELCDMILKVTKTAWWIGGSIIVIGWVVAGILYLTSAGGEKMAVAKKALIAAIIGTILVVLSATAASIVQNTLGGGATSQCGPLQ